MRYSIDPTGVEFNINNHLVIDSLSGRIILVEPIPRQVVPEGTIIIQVVAADRGAPAKSSITELELNVTDTNDHCPVISTPAAGEIILVEAPVPVNTTLVVVTAADLDFGENGQLTFRLGSELDASRFRIDSELGEIQNMVRLPFNDYRFSVLVSDNAVTPCTTSVSIHIKATPAEFITPDITTKSGGDVTSTEATSSTVTSTTASSTAGLTSSSTEETTSMTTTSTGMSSSEASRDTTLESTTSSTLGSTSVSSSEATSTSSMESSTASTSINTGTSESTSSSIAQTISATRLTSTTGITSSTDGAQTTTDTETSTTGTTSDLSTKQITTTEGTTKLPTMPGPSTIASTSSSVSSHTGEELPSTAASVTEVNPTITSSETETAQPCIQVTAPADPVPCSDTTLVGIVGGVLGGVLVMTVFVVVIPVAKLAIANSAGQGTYLLC